MVLHKSFSFMAVIIAVAAFAALPAMVGGHPASSSARELASLDCDGCVGTETEVLPMPATPPTITITKGPVLGGNGLCTVNEGCVELSPCEWYTAIQVENNSTFNVYIHLPGGGIGVALPSNTYYQIIKHKPPCDSTPDDVPTLTVGDNLHAEGTIYKQWVYECTDCAFN